MKRLGAIDAVRGLAVVLMVMHHCLDAWTIEPDRSGALWRALRHLGGVPAPSFMLLAGLSAALVLARERSKGVPARTRATGAVKRGLYVLGIAFAFRLLVFVVDANPWELVFRVDVLNCMGVCLALLGGLCALAPGPRGSAVIAAVLGLGFLLPAPFVFGTEFGGPWSLLAHYVSGTGTLVLFPLVPWLFFAAFGWLVGELWAALLAHPDPDRADRWMRWMLPIGVLGFFALWALSNASWSAFPPHDFWKASPVFAGMRVAIQLGLLGTAVLAGPHVDASGLGRTLQLLGRHSLVVYVVHLQLAYGRVAWGFQRKLSLPVALAGTAIVVAGSIALSRYVERRARLAPRVEGSAGKVRS